MAPKPKSRDAGNSDLLKKSHKLLPTGTKVKVLNVTRKEKEIYVEVSELYGKNESSILEIVKKEKEIPANFALSPPSENVSATAHDRCLWERHYIWKDMNRKRVPTYHKVC